MPEALRKRLRRSIGLDRDAIEEREDLTTADLAEGGGLKPKAVGLPASHPLTRPPRADFPVRFLDASETNTK